MCSRSSEGSTWNNFKIFQKETNNRNFSLLLAIGYCLYKILFERDKTYLIEKKDMGFHEKSLSPILYGVQNGISEL